MLDTPYPVLLEPDVPADDRRLEDGGDDGALEPRPLPLPGHTNFSEFSMTLLNNSTGSTTGSGVGFYHVKLCSVKVRLCVVHMPVRALRGGSTSRHEFVGFVPSSMLKRVVC